MSTILNRAAILAANDLSTETVEVPEWGGAVILRTMTGTQRDAYETSLMTKDAAGRYTVDTENMRAKLVIFTAVDKTGTPVFTLDDLGALAGKNAAVIERLFVTAQRINGLAKDAVADAEKNSVSGQSDASASDSPQPSA
ncbi:phage tail assembly chaperone [Burkholderia multivorans]|uniref:phage tail assembly chaperone n=1 Tax=Burkholderia multivorans TaxID=87883 RepID=UPI001C24E7B4|nr:phage tail assembly chaperone [Burkholderia multivorans]MBU9608251.1 phage tail assembly chaperone [Burkholderia multivorans]